MAMKKCLSLFVSLFLLVVVGCLSEESFAQQPLTWQRGSREIRGGQSHLTGGTDRHR